MHALYGNELEDSRKPPVQSLQKSTQKLFRDLEQLDKACRADETLQPLTSLIRQKFQSLACNWETLVDEIGRIEQVGKILENKRIRKELRKKARTQELDHMEQQLKDKERTWQRSLQHLHSLLSESLQQAQDFARHTTARRRKYHESQNVQIIAAEKELLGSVAEPPEVRETRLRPAVAAIPSSPPRTKADESITESQIDAEYDKVLDEVTAGNVHVNTSNISMDKDVGGWDSSLESEQPSFVSSASADEIKRALMYLKKASLLSPMLAESKDPSDVEAAMLLIKAQQRKAPNVHQRKQSFPPKPPTPTHKPAWKRTLHISQPGDSAIDLASTTPKSEMMQIVEGMLDKTMVSNPPQSTRSIAPPEEVKVEDSLLDVKLEDILKVPSFMGTEMTVQAEEEKVATVADAGQTQDAIELGDQVLPFREIKVPPSTHKKRENTDYHYTGQTYQGSTKGSSGLKSKIALRTGEAEDSHFRLTGQSQSVLMTPQTKEKAL